MQNILREIDNNIIRKKLEIMKQELHKMSSKTDIMNIEIKTVIKTYDHILLKNKPVGSGSNAIKYLKLQF